VTLAYKFLAAGAIGPLSRFAWPTPRGDTAGDWVVTTGPIVVGRHGAHVCRADQLAHWLHDELWTVEIAGDEVAALDCVVVARARLVRHVTAWRGGGAAQFAAACVDHARSRAPGALVDDAADALAAGYPAVAAYSAALAVAAAAAGEGEAAYARERAWQSAWIARELLR
jgi:hypothetical protein